MALRIRSRWRGGRSVTLEDNSTALAYAIWQVSLNAAKNLHAEKFQYDDDRQRVAVIAEYLCFLVHVSDRLAYRSLDDEQRQRYIATLAGETARHLQRNAAEVLGRGDYRARHIALFNERSADYAATGFADGQPGFDMLRYLGHKVQEILGTSQVNRWAIDQVMEIDAPGAVDRTRRAYDELFSTSPD